MVCRIRAVSQSGNCGRRVRGKWRLGRNAAAPIAHAVLETYYKKKMGTFEQPSTPEVRRLHEQCQIQAVDSRSVNALRTHRFWQDFDWLLLGAAIALSIISLTEIYSSTMNAASENYFLRQLAWVAVGIVSLFIVAAIDYHVLSEHIPWIYLLAVGVLLYTLDLRRDSLGFKELGVGSAA